MTLPEVQQLQDQQALLTQALAAMLQGRWCGAPPSTQAFVSALDPNLQIACQTPVLASAAPPAPPVPRYNPATEQPPQWYSWTCSICASDWVCRAVQQPFADDIYASREQCGYAIGIPDNVNSTYGLMDGSGTELQRAIRDQTGLDSSQGWLDYDTAYAIYAQTFGCMSGGGWYHWVGVRGVDGQGNLWIANSAPGYDGVWDTLSRADFNRLGPFSCVWVV